MAKATKEQAEKELKNGTADVSKEDLDKVLDKQEQIEDKFVSDGPLGRYISDVKLLFAILRDYAAGRYRRIPWWTVAAITAALLYVLNPLDLIPDFIPMFGYVDDALVLGTCFTMIESDLHKYWKWKKGQK